MKAIILYILLIKYEMITLCFILKYDLNIVLKIRLLKKFKIKNQNKLFSIIKHLIFRIKICIMMSYILIISNICRFYLYLVLLVLAFGHL